MCRGGVVTLKIAIYVLVLIITDGLNMTNEIEELFSSLPPFALSIMTIIIIFFSFLRTHELLGRKIL